MDLFVLDAEINHEVKDAFYQCCLQMRDAISPLDKLAHLLTATRVVMNSVSWQVRQYISRHILAPKIL